jgi:hypothetical protein
MSKIVYNNCFGGFSLSRAAIEEYMRLKGKKVFFYVSDGDFSSNRYRKVGDDEPSRFCEHALLTDLGETTTNAELNKAEWFHDREIERHDPDFVAVVEKLGVAADGSCAKLKIIEIPSGTLYRIDEYDGNESVATQDTYDWKVAP